ncbi:recombinase family protein [Kordia sp.]|uniref:recombinase family protein n=1 Tax=Kordia sp. TaxID=1965332 RepID=UPI0025C2233C|nr:recombinase family protein [Kordia sp.]MCH2196568.1 recombinase family protein [Kordia sp.]
MHSLIHSDKAKLTRKAFEWKANESISNVEIIKRQKKCELTIQRQYMTRIFRNPIYCGLLANRLLDGKIIKGNHKPIVSKELFSKVNNINTEKNGIRSKQRKNNPNLPMRGFVKCDACGKPITGYIEKKYNLAYYRDHTKGCCGYNRAEKLNEKFITFLATFQIDEKLIAPLKLQMKFTFDYFNESNKDVLEYLKYNLNTIKEKM